MDTLDNKAKPLAFYVILLMSLFLAFVIAIYPLPAELNYFRPEFICLLVILWTITDPEHLGLVFAFVVGLAQDLLEQSVWGGHAMALTIVALVCQMSGFRIKSYSVWHQSMWVFVLVGIHQVLVNWVQSLAGYTAQTRWILTSTAISALLWPVVHLLLRRIRVAYLLH